MKEFRYKIKGGELVTQTETLADALTLFQGRGYTEAKLDKIEERKVNKKRKSKLILLISDGIENVDFREIERIAKENNVPSPYEYHTFVKETRVDQDPEGDIFDPEQGVIDVVYMTTYKTEKDYDSEMNEVSVQHRYEHYLCFRFKPTKESKSIYENLGLDLSKQQLHEASEEAIKELAETYNIPEGYEWNTSYWCDVHFHGNDIDIEEGTCRILIYEEQVDEERTGYHYINFRFDSSQPEIEKIKKA